MTRVLVCGSRDYTDKETLWAALDEFHTSIARITVLIEGEAPGADTLAKEWYEERKGIDHLTHTAINGYELLAGCSCGWEWGPFDVEDSRDLSARKLHIIQNTGVKDALEVRAMVLEPYPADWKRYGNAAGAIRNTQMLVEGKPDIVLAFPTGRLSITKGTKNMVQQARKAGVRTIVYGIDDIGVPAGQTALPIEGNQG
jgi:hypothetical protein